MHAGDDMAERARREIAERHRFFVEWFTGRAPPEALDAAMAAFADDFCRIAPDGSMQTRLKLKVALEGAAGRYPACFDITVAFEHARAFAGGPVAVRYVERQSGQAGAADRRASALLAPNASTGAMQWISVHETWMGNAGN